MMLIYIGDFDFLAERSRFMLLYSIYYRNADRMAIRQSFTIRGPFIIEILLDYNGFRGLGESRRFRPQKSRDDYRDAARQ